jgi:DeoR/GlpR family transcriptional regulator of sugar metabolism
MNNDIGQIELAQERRRQILARLQAEGKVIAAELSRRYGVSEDTIRRDLREMAQAGLLQRVHGGALPLSPSLADFATRQKQARPARLKLAQAAARLVQTHQVIMFDGGTTTLEVARQLDPQLKATAITLSPEIALVLAAYPGLEVILIGGRLDKHERVSGGAAALESLLALRADLCFFGLCSLHPELGLTAGHYEEVPLKRAMIAGAGEVIAVVTADKFGAAAPFTVAPIQELTQIVTEAAVPAETLLPYRQAGIEIIQPGGDA